MGNLLVTGDELPSDLPDRDPGVYVGLASEQEWMLTQVSGRKLIKVETEASSESGTNGARLKFQSTGSVPTLFLIRARKSIYDESASSFNLTLYRLDEDGSRSIVNESVAWVRSDRESLLEVGALALELGELTPEGKRGAIIQALEAGDYEILARSSSQEPTQIRIELYQLSGLE